MFMYLQKSKKGFTLIELMVVVAIIGILALLGLRLYAGQQRRAKDAIAIANAATIHTLIQANLVDATYAATQEGIVISDAIGTATNAANTANLRNPYDGADASIVARACTIAGAGDATDGDLTEETLAAGDLGVVLVLVNATDEIMIQAVGEGVAGGPVLIGNMLTALK